MIALLVVALCAAPGNDLSDERLRSVHVLPRAAVNIEQDHLAAIARDDERPVFVRVRALHLLAAHDVERAVRTWRAMSVHPNQEIRFAALSAWARARPSVEVRDLIAGERSLRGAFARLGLPLEIAPR